ncbi:MAG: tail fiber protein, partial [Proteobacteria bacterium]|nr:tail fiber protein [Pseudomonadota bacterium]
PQAFLPGMLMPYAGSAAPSGWLLCAGQAVSRVTFAGLFAILGTVYGSGDGSTTFNLPDLRGRTLVGLDNMGGTSANRITATQADTLGGTAGTETATPSGSVALSGTVGDTTLSIGQIPSHSHDYMKDTWFSGSGGLSGNAARADATPSSSVGGGGSHNHSFSGSGTFTGAAMNITQPWMAMNYIIKT